MQSGCLEEAREVAALASCAFQGFYPRPGLPRTPTPSLTPVSFATSFSAWYEARAVLSVACGRLWPPLCRCCNVMSGCYRSGDSGTGALRSRSTAACFRAPGGHSGVLSRAPLALAFLLLSSVLARMGPDFCTPKEEEEEKRDPETHSQAPPKHRLGANRRPGSPVEGGGEEEGKRAT